GVRSASAAHSTTPPRSCRWSGAHNHVLRIGLAELTDPDPPTSSKLRATDRAYRAALDDLIRRAGSRSLNPTQVPPGQGPQGRAIPRLRPSTIDYGQRPEEECDG